MKELGEIIGKIISENQETLPTLNEYNSNKIKITDEVLV